MAAHTSAYLDCPFHRYADGKDLAPIGLEQIADLEGLVVRATLRETLVIDASFFQVKEVHNWRSLRSESSEMRQ